MSKCGFPAFDITGANVDVTVIRQRDGKAETEDVGDNETLSSDQVAIPRSKNGKISFNGGNGRKKDATCGKMRKLYVTITNIPPLPETNSTRLLQTTSNLAISFTASEGDDSYVESSARSLFFGAFLTMISLAVMAF